MLLAGQTKTKADHDHLDGETQTGEASSDINWIRFEKDDSESSTQTTAKEQPVSKPNASTQSEETNPVKVVDPATNAIDAIAE